MPAAADEQGQATVETALLLPVVALIVSVLVQIGLAGVDEVRLWHAAREGARAAAVDPGETAVRKAVQQAGLHGVRISITPSPQYRRAGAAVTVRLSYEPGYTTPVVGRLVGPRVLRAQASMRIEQP